MKRLTAVFILSLISTAGLLTITGFHVHYQNSEIEIYTGQSSDHNEENHARTGQPEKTLMEHVLDTAFNRISDEDCLQPAVTLFCEMQSGLCLNQQSLQTAVKSEQYRELLFHLPTTAPRPPPVSV